MGLQPLQQRSEALTRERLEYFLAGIEKRAYRMAMVSMRNRDDALDVVQDAMMQLVAKYPHKGEEEWPKLFFRILHNKMMDVHRKRKRQGLFSNWFNRQGDDEFNPDELNPVEQTPAPSHTAPQQRLEGDQTLALLEQAISRLPARQQQAFMLRCWEGFSTAETAATMGCSEGSVKTHYSRALHALKSALGGLYE